MNTTIKSKEKSSKIKGVDFVQSKNKLHYKPIALKTLMNRLSEAYDEHKSQQINQILSSRQKKLSSLRKQPTNSILNQPPLIPAKTGQIFSECSPISTGQQYLPQKIRTNILLPKRAYQWRTNMKAGSIDSTKMEKIYSQMDERVIRLKFEDYDRIIDEQSGAVKRRRLMNLSAENQSLPAICESYKASMKKTYFKKFGTDNYNFYKPPIKHISRRADYGFESPPTNPIRQATERSRVLSKSIPKPSELTLSRQVSYKGLKSPKSPRSPPRSPRSRFCATEQIGVEYQTLENNERKTNRTYKQGIRTLDTLYNA